MLQQSANCKIPQCSTHVAGFLSGHCLDNSDSQEPSINGIAKYHRITVQRKLPTCTTLIPCLLVGRCSRNTKTMEATIGDETAFKRVLIQQKSTLSN